MVKIRALIFTLFTLTFLLVPVASASAQMVTTDSSGADNGASLTLYQGIGSDYVYQDFGITASPHVVAEGGATFSWQSGDSIDLWYSSGAGGPADEIDVSYQHNGSFASPVGSFDYQAKLAYYFLNLGGGKLFTPVDDALYAHFDMGRSLSLGKVELMDKNGVRF